MKFIKCNLVGLDCKYMVKGESEADVMKQYASHLQSSHKMNPRAFEATIKQAVRTR